MAKPLNITFVMIFWNVSGICDNYTISTTQLCTNEVLPPKSGFNGTLSSIIITGLSSGYEYSVSVTPVNILGEGTALTETVITPGTSNVKLNIDNRHYSLIIIQILLVVLLCY